jgi:hypothetical protein
VVGKLDAIEPLKTPFEDFVRSVRFDRPGEPITWDPPKDWTRLPPNPERYATFRAGAKDGAPELTVHHYDGAGQMGSIPENVVRWGRMYAGVKVTEDNWDQYVQPGPKTEDGAAITFVDMKGPGGKGGGMKPPLAGGANPHAPADAGKITYTVPEGWKEADKVVSREGIEVRYEAALKVEEGGASALLTVSKFPQNAGGLLPNINRWRKQVGLPPVDEKQLSKDATKVQVGGVPAFGVDYKGPQQRVLGVVAPRGDWTWFIKLDGPADLVGKQKVAFDKFVGSVIFDGGNGG